MQLIDTHNEKSKMTLDKWTAVHLLTLMHLFVFVTSVPREKFIMFGEHISIETMPHSVIILIAYKWPNDLIYCSGSILQHRWVLGAAHCFDESFKFSKKQGLIKIRFGIDTFTQEGLVSDVEKIIFHEGYKQSIGNDLCLLKTFDEVPFGRRVYPSWRPWKTDKLELVTQVRVAGWGVTEITDWPWYLSAVNLPMINTSECGIHSSHDLTVVEPGTFFCAGKKERDAKSPCHGDTGAIAASNWKDNRSWVAIGLAVRSQCVGPTVFMYVPYYVDWIVDKIRKFS